MLVHGLSSVAAAALASSNWLTFSQSTFMLGAGARASGAAMGATVGDIAKGDSMIEMRIMRILPWSSELTAPPRHR